ncbi:hypothetical protein BDU57DRAFT_523334 [Ampelomyces quisqualis]|uniref:Uncharacterized protein n=1 Tax=Ampelomyces quisqualis TaxID=50730 RepID=A0A6A5Q8L9_AMPQU|nr:hypothetical protein BDU57DRAFT_523334 [Ampelomyces quisqualis]
MSRSMNFFVEEGAVRRRRREIVPAFGTLVPHLVSPLVMVITIAIWRAKRVRWRNFLSSHLKVVQDCHNKNLQISNSSIEAAAFVSSPCMSTAPWIVSAGNHSAMPRSHDCW